MTTRRVLPVLAGIAVVAAVAGCGSGGDGNASGSTPGGDDKAELAFAKCMRAAGINVSDPDGSGRVQIRIKASPGHEFSPEKVGQATNDCRKKTGGGPRQPTAAEQTEMRDRALKFSQCMREHGIDMPDPKFEGGGIAMSVGRGKIDPESSVFKRAAQACERFQPMLRKGAGPSANVDPPGAPADGGGATQVPAP